MPSGRIANPIFKPREFFNEHPRAGWDSYYLDPFQPNKNLSDWLASYYDTSQRAYQMRTPLDADLSWMDWLDQQKDDPQGAFDPVRAFSRLAARQRGEDPNRYAPPAIYRTRY